MSNESNKRACAKYREKNREIIRERAKTYRKNKVLSDPDFLKSKTEKKFNLDAGSIDKMLKSQQNRCLITQEVFEDRPKAYCVDHNHETGEVRGLLSQKANSALGFLKEDPESFYRAVAYLTLDPDKPLIYIIGSLRNEKVPEVAREVRAAGYDAFDNWFSAGKTADDSWQEYSRSNGKTYAEALSSREANHVFRFDKAYLDLCSAAILVGPAGKSGFMELGYIVGMGKPAYILLDETTEDTRYDVMPQFATMVTSDLNEIIGDLNGERPTVQSGSGEDQSIIDLRRNAKVAPYDLGSPQLRGTEVRSPQLEEGNRGKVQGREVSPFVGELYGGWEY